MHLQKSCFLHINYSFIPKHLCCKTFALKTQLFGRNTNIQISGLLVCMNWLSEFKITVIFYIYTHTGIWMNRTCSRSFLYLCVACWMRSLTVHPSLQGTTTPVCPKVTVTFMAALSTASRVQALWMWVRTVQLWWWQCQENSTLHVTVVPRKWWGGDVTKQNLQKEKKRRNMGPQTVITFK